MNKLITKIVGAALGLTMAVGVGVAVGASKREAVPVHAVEETFSFANPTESGSGTSYELTWTSSYLSIHQEKSNSATSVSSSYKTAPRFYQNHIITFTPLNSSTITKLEFVYNGGKYTTTTWSTGSATVDTNNTKVTWTGTATSAFTLTAAAQMRVTSLKVTYSSSATVSSVSITGTTTVTSGTKGLATTQLTGTVSYSSGTGTNGLSWTSGTPSVATVSSTGLVTFLDNGSSLITATSTEDGTKSASVTVTASNLEAAKGGADNPFSISEICTYIDGAYDGTSTEYVYGIVSEKGEWSTQFNSANIFLTDNGNSDSENSIELFRFADETAYDAISVGDYVVVSGVWTKYGSIYETTQGNSDIDTSTISKVASINAVSGSNSYPTGTTLAQSDFLVDATYANSYVAEDVNGYTFTVNGESGASLVEGNNTIVVSYLGKTKTLSITGVSVHITEIIIDDTASVEETKTTQLTILTNPENGYSDTVVWTSSDESKATVNQTGLVSGIAAGSATITAFADRNDNGELDTGEVSASCTVTITERAVSNLSINGKTTSFAAGDAFTLGNATITVTFSDEGTLTIDEDDSNLVYYIGTQDAVNNKTANTISIGDTLLAEHNGLYVKAYYKNVGASAYSITVSAPFDYSLGTFYKVTSEPADWTGSYILVYESGNVAFHGADAAKASTPVTIDESDRIEPVNNLAVIDIAAMEGGYSIKVRNGTMIDKYLGATSDTNGLSGNASAVANTISLDASGNVDISSSSAHLRYNAAADQARFRFYKSSSYSSQKSIQIYKYRSNAEVISEFITNYMKLDQYVGDETYNEERCNSNYSAAKTAFNNLTSTQRALFVSEGGEGGAYQEAYERLVKWAEAHHESIGTDENNNTNVLKSAQIVSIFGNENNNLTAVIIVIVSLVSITAIGAYFFIKKRKEQ